MYYKYDHSIPARSSYWADLVGVTIFVCSCWFFCRWIMLWFDDTLCSCVFLDSCLIRSWALDCCCCCCWGAATLPRNICSCIFSGPDRSNGNQLLHQPKIWRLNDSPTSILAHGNVPWRTPCAQQCTRTSWNSNERLKKCTFSHEKTWNRIWKIFMVSGSADVRSYGHKLSLREILFLDPRIPQAGVLNGLISKLARNRMLVCHTVILIFGLISQYCHWTKSLHDNIDSNSQNVYFRGFLSLSKKHLGRKVQKSITCLFNSSQRVLVR